MRTQGGGVLIIRCFYDTVPPSLFRKHVMKFFATLSAVCVLLIAAISSTAASPVPVAVSLFIYLSLSIYLSSNTSQQESELLDVSSIRRQF